MHAEYLHAINVNKRKRSVDFVLEEIKTKGIEFDTIAVRGFSGTSVGSMVAYLLDKPLCYIRKKEELCCSCNRVEFDDNDKIGRFLIIDDLIDSGNTATQIIKSVMEHDSEAECVGSVLYRTRYYYPRKNLFELIGMELAPPPPKPEEKLPETLNDLDFSVRSMVALDFETCSLNSSYPPYITSGPITVRDFRYTPPDFIKQDSDFSDTFSNYDKVSKLLKDNFTKK